MINKRIQQFAHACLEGNAERAWQVLQTYRDEGCNSLSIYNDVITEAMYYIGELWEENEVTVAQEHLASSVCRYILANYARETELAARSKHNIFCRKKAMFLCLENEQHSLGIHMVSNYFTEAGWDTNLLGADLPLHYAVEHARMWKPDVIGLSVSVVYQLPNLLKYTIAFEALEHKPHILVGGRLAELYPLEQYCSGNVTILQNMRQLDVWLEAVRSEIRTDAKDCQQAT